jgi:hypothetical protein
MNGLFCILFVNHSIIIHRQLKMPLQFWKKWTKTKKMTPLEIDVSNAIGHYNEAVDEDDKRNFRNALHMYEVS